MRIRIIHGPNLNLLGTREPDVYGAMTLAQINSTIEKKAAELNVETSFFQSNHEGELIDCLHNCVTDSVDGIIINPAAYTHTSVALRDAVAAIALPVIEVHLSNVHAREEFRSHSYLAAVALAQISGLGAYGYCIALDGLVEHICKHSPPE